MLIIIDNGMGNIESVANAMSEIEVDCFITNEAKYIRKANSIIFPGVGAYPRAIKNLKNLSLLEEIKKSVLIEKTPFLGICLGMQLLFDESEEQGLTKGLGFIKGKVKRLKHSFNSPVPHVGWNGLELIKENPLFLDIDTNAKFYYDHSYFATTVDQASFATLDYGEKMTVGVWKNNIFGVQFHPEKSQRNGLKLLRNFVNFSKEVKLS